ncbi:hypothetical protein D9O50_03660 [Oxalobacteraceae bacterium CAVE-383]|nr:hypothetical protein D9O50_03660 [Oxalobacteraceae bacterium CAVE-383]
MKVDVYKRLDSGNLHSYMAVPTGQAIPEEATNTDWEIDRRNVDLEPGKTPQSSLKPDDALQQIDEKGYAITHLKDRL